MLSTAMFKQRRSLSTLVTIACLVYTSHITVQLLTGINRSDKCHQRASSMRHLMSRNFDSKQQISEEKMKNAREALAKSNIDSNKKPYRLDVIEADLERVSSGQEPDERIDAAEDKTDYFGCVDFDRIPRTRKEVEENLRGNRGISFLKVRINGVIIQAVIKEANRLYRTVVEEYKYNSAKREILYLNKLRGIRGIPRLLGSCVEELRIRYLVERINGLTLCNDNGTTTACAQGDNIVNLIKTDPNPKLAAITFAYSTTMFFQQLEDRHLFMEDVSGLNFMLTPDWQLFMVDADSLVFYNDSRIYSHVSCNADDHCPSPSGNLWVDFSLNMKIYKQCRDLTGICEDNECTGFGTELHACGVSHWYMCRLAEFFKDSTAQGKTLREVCSCMGEKYPHKRCTFREASRMLRVTFGLFLEEKKDRLPK